jgi:predicted nucleic acid-binding protein
MKPKTYIETSIPSFYYEIRNEPDMIARRQWTRQWWEECRPHYEIFTSDAVLDELRRGHYPIQAETLALASQIPLLPLEEPIFEIVEVYLQHKLMPQNPLGDALHLAIASYHKCDFLLTWNCQNLANANKFAHIKRINNLLGLYLPTLITPLELLGETS